MTREERQFFYNELKKLFLEWVEETKGTGYVYSDLSTFADSYMSTITGQQALPQEVFRIFLDKYVPLLTSPERDYYHDLYQKKCQETIDQMVAIQLQTIIGDGD